MKYDHQALERHILNRFIHGKPMIVVDDIPHVVYRKDIYTTSTFAEVRKKVAPQVSIIILIFSQFCCYGTIPDPLFFA